MPIKALFASLLAGGLLVASLGGCGDAPTTYSDDPIPDGSPSSIGGAADGVNDGSEGGLDLDGGNVPGSGTTE